MKQKLARGIYLLFTCLTAWGILATAVLYPTHAANGTSIAYLTVILFPTVFLLAGLSSVFWRHWWVLPAAGAAVLAVYLFAVERESLTWLWLLAGYLVCGIPAGLAGHVLRRGRKFSK